MKKVYKVIIQRTRIENFRVDIVAKNEQEATEKALQHSLKNGSLVSGSLVDFSDKVILIREF